MIKPIWAQMEIVSGLIRREPDPRTYHNLFKSSEENIGGIRGVWLRQTSHKCPEPNCLETLSAEQRFGSTVVVFKGLSDYFSKLNGWNKFLYQEIRAITRPHWLKEVEAVAPQPIGIHVRRGDFIPQKTGAASQPKPGYAEGLATSITWYVKSLEIIRERLGFCAETVVVSDGSTEALKELLSLPKVNLISTGSAISDMLVLSRSKILIGSGGSTFTAWASFWGQMPTVIRPGHSLAWYGLESQGGAYQGEFDPASPPPEFMDQLKKVAAPG